MMEPVEISTWTQDHNEDVRAVISDELLPEFLDMNPDISDVTFRMVALGRSLLRKAHDVNSIQHHAGYLGACLGRVR